MVLPSVAKVAQLPSPDRMHTVTFNPPPSPAPCISVIFLRANLHSPQPHRKLKAADQADPYSHNEADRSLQAFSNERTSPLLGRCKNDLEKRQAIICAAKVQEPGWEEFQLVLPGDTQLWDSRVRALGFGGSGLLKAFGIRV